jgi:Gas vesicle synthesis protein GvpL/GvpF/Lsr2
MATVTQATLICDVCGNAKDVKAWMFGLDDKTYEIDLCKEDGNALNRLAAGYISKARKVAARPGRRESRRQYGGRPRVRTAAADSGDETRTPGQEASGRGRLTGSPRGKARASRSEQEAAAASGASAGAAGPKKTARTSRLRLQDADGASTQAAWATGARAQKAVYVYGILPADIEVAAGMPGVGEHPGMLRAVRFDGLAALISEVDLSGRLGSPDDLRTYREIMDATAVEVPVLPLRFGTVLPSEDAVSEELLAARHDEFAAALDQLEGRAEFQVKGRYVKSAVLGEVLSRNEQAARRLQEKIQAEDPDAARNARIELDQLINETVTARRLEDKRTLRQAMAGISVASVTREPTHQLDAVDAAFIVALDQERKVERVIEDLARAWEGRIDVHLLGPMAAYDFAGTAQPEADTTRS